MVNVLDPDLSQISDSKNEKGNSLITESERQKKEENQRKRGRRAEGIVYKAEVKRLKKAGREDLADEVKMSAKPTGMDMISNLIMKMAVTVLLKQKVQQLMDLVASFTYSE